MGNQSGRQSIRNTNRRRSLPTKNVEEDNTSYQRRNYNTINQSLQVTSVAEPKKYNSIDYSQNADDIRSIKSERLKMKLSEDKDKILQKLSQKNEELRKQLKKISEELSEQIKRKKFVPKKKGATADDEEAIEEKNQANAGIRRELENAYRQIEMYKRTIESMKGKDEQHQSNLRLNQLQNAISTVDAEINSYLKKVQGSKKVKKVQDKVIEKDINEDIISTVNALKKESGQVKNTLKQYAKRDRQRDVNYKRQQAYLFQVEKKYRELHGDYFPQLKKKIAEPINPSNSRAIPNNVQSNVIKFTPEEYFELQQELNMLKARQGDYNKKIDAKVLQKNKILDEQGVLDENIRYSQRIIEALKQKLIELKKIFKPTKKSLFGYDSYSGAQLQSQFNGGVDQIEKEIQEQNNQDQFDIRHLIANIPKPARQKIVIQYQEDSNGVKRPAQSIAREASGEKGGMIISGEKSVPKKWGSSLTRFEEKGRPIKKEAVFDDSPHFPAQSKPLIIGINIWVNKNNAILGIQAIYLNGDEIRYGSKSSVAADGFLQRYDLQSPDYLKYITGAFSEQGYVQYLNFVSKQGKVGTYGFKNQNQEQFNFGLSSTERPFRVYGASFVFDSQPRLNRLGLQICQQQ